MTEKQILQRKIVLKTQAIKGIHAERDELRWRLSLHSRKEKLEGQIGESFNPALSRQLDCVQVLLDEEKEDRAHG